MINVSEPNDYSKEALLIELAPASGRPPISQPQRVCCGIVLPVISHPVYQMGFGLLKEKFETLKPRKLKKHSLYTFAKSACFRVIFDREGCKMPILAVVGIDSEGKREVFTFARETIQAARPGN